jgi:hypothetical protein
MFSSVLVKYFAALAGEPSNPGLARKRIFLPLVQDAKQKKTAILISKFLQSEN